MNSQKNSLSAEYVKFLHQRAGFTYLNNWFAYLFFLKGSPCVKGKILKCWNIWGKNLIEVEVRYLRKYFSNVEIFEEKIEVEVRGEIFEEIFLKCRNIWGKNLIEVEVGYLRKYFSNAEIFEEKISSIEVEVRALIWLVCYSNRIHLWLLVSAEDIKI